MLYLSYRSFLVEVYFGTKHKRGVRTLDLSTQQRDAHNKYYTTALPNTGIYDINASERGFLSVKVCYKSVDILLNLPTALHLEISNLGL